MSKTDVGDSSNISIPGLLAGSLDSTKKKKKQ